MSNRFFNKCFFILLFGVPLAFFTAYVINIRENSNFKSSYTESSFYKFGQGIANYLNREVIGKKVLGNVHFGKNGRLFYLPKSDGNVWNDLYGNKSMKNNFFLVIFIFSNLQVCNFYLFCVIIKKKEF